MSKIVGRNVVKYFYHIVMVNKENLEKFETIYSCYEFLTESKIRRLSQRKYPDYSYVSFQVKEEKFFCSMPLEIFVQTCTKLGSIESPLLDISKLADEKNEGE